MSVTARDAAGAVLYSGDTVRDLATDQLLEVLAVRDGGKVLLSSGVTTAARRVEVVL